MIDESQFGVRDKRGHWKPFEPVKYAPVFVWPVQLVNFLKWLPHYFLPFYAFFLALSSVLWWYLLPSTEMMKVFSINWIAYLVVLNSAMVFLYYGGFHLRLYILQKQGKLFKYNPRWPAKDNSAFMFANQTIDNMIWTFASAVPVLTAYEAVILWAFTNDYVQIVTFGDNPLYFVILMVLIPTIHEIHFYLIHRLIHWPPLYRTVHHIHHKNVNPGPWSGLSMHTVEHILFFSGPLLLLIIPAHPLHVIFYLVYAVLSPAGGHAGFDKVVVGEESAMDTHCYAHYLHHKYFECNYSDGVVPIDKWVGTFHDGSPEAQTRMNERLRERAKKQAERDAV